MNPMDETQRRAALSALMDGALDARGLETLMGDAATAAQDARDWHVYQVVGDVLRSAELAPRNDELDFLDRLELRLAQESATAVAAAVSEPVGSVAAPGRASANAPLWRLGVWASTFGLVLTVGFAAWRLPVSPQVAGTTSAGQTGGATASLLQTPGQPAMLRDPALDALLAAHSQLGGHSVLQRPSGFLRNATYEVAR